MLQAGSQEAATRYTLAFVGRHLEHSQGRRLLEVGCGDGALALALSRKGFEVVAIDASADRVAAARREGVDARHENWPSFSGAERDFDAILFTRSLHHMHALEDAISVAVELLGRSGLVIVEDFDHCGVNEHHLRWLHAIVRLIDHAGYEFRAGTLCAELIANGNDPALWRRQHDHDLHDAVAMQSAIEAPLALVESSHCAYLFRYLLDDVERTVDSSIASELLTLEESMGLLDEKWLIGRRFVAKKLPSKAELQ